MILVLAQPRDEPARRLVEAWRAHDARLLVVADLSKPGWRHWLGEPGDERAVVGGEVVPTVAVTGVLVRIGGVTAEDLPHVVEPDRAYVAAEITAFLTSWLTALPCPVLNRPVSNSLMGAPHGNEGWAIVGARAGLRVAHPRVAFPSPPPAPWPREAVTVSVLGERVFGDVPPELADQARRLAAAARVELLAVSFDSAAPNAAFLGAHLWPDLALPALAAALLERFAR